MPLLPSPHAPSQVWLQRPAGGWRATALRRAAVPQPDPRSGPSRGERRRPQGLGRRRLFFTGGSGTRRRSYGGRRRRRRRLRSQRRRLRVRCDGDTHTHTQHLHVFLLRQNYPLRVVRLSPAYLSLTLTCAHARVGRGSSGSTAGPGAWRRRLRELTGRRRRRGSVRAARAASWSTARRAACSGSTPPPTPSPIRALR